MIVCTVVFSKFFIYGAELVGVSDKICGESLMVALVEVAAAAQLKVFTFANFSSGCSTQIALGVSECQPEY